MGAPRAVLFDFGRVISAPKPASLFESYERDLGLPRGSINRIMFDDPAWEDTLTGRLSLDDYWRIMGPRLNLRSAEAVAAFRARYDADERPNEPVIRIIRRLYGRVPLAVLSNAPKGLKAWLERWDVLCFFHAVFCSAEEGVRKPFPQAYITTLERLHVAPPQALFVDDAPENVEAARSLGIVSHLYRDPQGLSLFLEEHGVVP
ncbi:MAG: HAD family phosphatase [Desulfosoma sp.]